MIINNKKGEILCSTHELRHFIFMKFMIISPRLPFCPSIPLSARPFVCQSFRLFFCLYLNPTLYNLNL